ncbi:MAG: ABC transporter permease [Candidatus Aminicenantes bacterium]|nr:ABC transporter permease [Candidatus Aminicenantes bacterium]
MNRIKAIIVKEFFHILRDPRSLTIIFFTPIIMIVILGYSVSYDLNRIDAVVVDFSRSDLSRQLVQSFANNRIYVLHKLVRETGSQNQLHSAEAMLRREEIKAIIIIPVDFARSLTSRGQSDFGIIIDGSNSNTANLIYQYNEMIVLNFMARMKKVDQLLNLRTKVYFNPEARSAVFFIPGQIAAILLMISAMLTSISISKERESGSIALLFISPLKSHEIIIGKTIPYIIVALLDGVLTLFFSRFWFGITIRGNLAVLLLFAVLYIISGLSIGILISTSARTQKAAMLAAQIFTMLPSYLLSGFIFPLDSLSPFLRGISKFIPATYFLRIIRGVVLKGSQFEHFIFEGMMLILLSVILLTAAVVKFNLQRKAVQ